MAEYPPAPRFFLTPGLLSHHKATRALNGISKASYYFPGLGMCQAPGRELWGAGWGQPFLVQLGTRAGVGRCSVNSTGARTGRRKPQMLLGCSQPGSRAAFASCSCPWRGLLGGLLGGLHVFSVARAEGVGQRRTATHWAFWLPALSSQTNGNLC